MSRARLPRATVLALACGAAFGAADLLLSLDAARRFAAGLELALAGLHLASLHGLLAALGVLALWLGARLAIALGGPGVSLATRAGQARDRAAAGDATAFHGPVRGLLTTPLLAAALTGAWFLGLGVLAGHRHQGLVVAAVMALTLAALFVALGLAALLSRALARLLARALAGPERLAWRRRLAQPALGFALHGVTGLVALGIIAALTRETWRLLPWPVGLAGLGLIAVMLGALAVARLGREPEPAGPQATGRLALVSSLLVLALVALVLTGERDAVRKAAAAASPLAGPVVGAVSRLTDFDGDGSGSLLGGGDCGPFDARVHPGAIDLPGNGIDDDCLGGDGPPPLAREPSGFAPLPATVPRDANLLLVIVDTLRADHVGAYGYPRPVTPRIDRLARAGVVFENAWAHAPSTRYAIPSILTGRWPSQILWDESVWWPALRPENVTLAERLGPLGLFTAAILNYRYFDRVRRLDQGFAHYDNENAKLHAGRDPASTKGSSSREQADAAIRFLGEHAGQRFFLWLHLYDPHHEFEKHPEVTDFGDRPIDVYDNEILYTDTHLGRVLDQLVELGIDDKTIVVVTGDHGEGFGEHGIAFHGYHLYAPQTKVPLVVRVPGLAPRRVRTPVGHVDLLPTLVNLAGGGPDPALVGRSLVPALTGAPDEPDRPVFQEVIYEGPTERRAVVTGRWHLIHNLMPDATYELYDLARDPGETRDLFATEPVPALRQTLDRWSAAARFAPEALAAISRAVSDERPDPAWPVDRVFGQALRLVGLDPETRSVRAGDRIAFAYHLAPTAELFVQPSLVVKLDTPRPIVGEHVPGEGFLPTRAMTRDRFVSDRVVLSVPAGTPPGEYRVLVGVKKGKRRLKPDDGPTDGDLVPAGTVEVTR